MKKSTTTVQSVKDTFTGQSEFKQNSEMKKNSDHIFPGFYNGKFSSLSQNERLIGFYLFIQG